MTFLTTPERAIMPTESCTCKGTGNTYISCSPYNDNHFNPCIAQCLKLEICATPTGMKISQTGLGAMPQ